MSPRARFLTSVAVATLAAACQPQAAPPPPLTTPVQAAALELGFATGSMVAQVALPLPLRQESFAGFTRDEASLRAWARRVGLDDPDAGAAVVALRDGFADSSPLTGAQRILEAGNLFKDRLAAGAHPSLMNAFRIGFVVAHTTETAVVLTQGNPNAGHLQTFNALTGRYRATLRDDLAQAQLPSELVSAVERAAVDAQSVDDLAGLIGACLTVKDLVAQMNGD